MTQENSLLGKFHLNEIPPMPRDALEIDVTFDVDANGILNVSIQDEPITISTRRDVCLRTKCECAKRTMSSWALSAGNLVLVSEQQFANCNTTVVGCDERSTDYTSAFAEKNTVCTEGNCLHTAQDGTCNLSGW